MQHIEPLDRRSLMAASGVDPTFGNKGTLSAAGELGRPDATLAIAGAVFVEYNDERGQVYIAKYNDAGELDRTWGRRGRAWVAFDVEQMTYDARAQRLYAAGTSYGDNLAYLHVEKFTTRGTPDRYGTESGLPQYVTHSGDDKRTRLGVRELLVQPKGRVAVLFDRDVGVTTGDLSTTTQGIDDVVVMQLNDRGTREIGFANRGTLSVLAGEYRGSSSDITTTRAGRFLTARDLAGLPDGELRVVLSYDVARYEELNFDGSSTYHATQYVKSRRISVTGRVSEAEAYSWLLPDTTPSQQVTPRVMTAEDGGAGVVTVLAETTTRSSRERRVMRYRLTPGRRLAATSVAVNGIDANHVVRAPRGEIYVGDDSGNVARYRSDLRPDRAFGVNGTASGDLNTVVRYVPDAAGRLLVVGDDRLVRLK